MLNLINQRNLEVNSGCEINKHKTQNLWGGGGGGGEGGLRERKNWFLPLAPTTSLGFSSSFFYFILIAINKHVDFY